MSVPSAPPVSTRTGDRAATAVCLFGAAAAIAAPLLAGEITGATGDAVTAELLADSGRIQGAAAVAALGAAALLVATARLRRALPGTAGAVASSAGAAVAVLMAGMYAAFAAGAVVADYLLENPSGAVGEGSLLLFNLVELTRYAPGLAVLAAAVVARRALPRPVVLGAGVLLLMMLLPFTTWLAALVTPVWLGVAGGVLRTPDLPGQPAGRDASADTAVTTSA